MKSHTRYLLIVVTIFLLSLCLLPTGSARRNSIEPAKTGGAQSPSQDQNPVELTLPQSVQKQSSAATIPVLVEMTDAPATQVYAEVMANPVPSKHQKILEARAATQSQTAQIAQKQERLAVTLTSSRFAAREIYRVRRAVNGIAVQVAPDKLAEIRRLPGVKAVYPIEPEYPTNSTSVPFLGTPQVWGNSLGLNATGSGIKIAIIDTGLDYQHAMFGGTGLLADYQANDRTVAPDAYFPTAKVVGGYDFAGDNYNGGNAPVPDPDPMDCLGHGSHVAGTAAGYGVKSDGTTYTGPFDESANYGALRIGPGTAPGASLYSLRVFGCGGSTGLTVQAIDWAMDPNGDNDLSDHLDVINMSLGSNFGSLANTTAIASDNAALAGVVVVASAGNAGDTYFIGGAPGSGSRVISTAASADSGAMATVNQAVRANAPAGIAGTFYAAGGAAFGSTPPTGGLTANVVQALDPADGAGPLTTDGCSPLTNAAAIAGNIAFIDRGTCGFAVKVKNAQNAGAIGVIVANNVSGVATMGGADATITIPSVLVTQTDGNTLRTNLASLNATLFAPSDTVASFSSRGPRLGSLPALLKPDITAPGLNITSTQTGVTCTGSSPSTGCLVSNASGYIPSNQALTISGTSMAAPHMAGIMALLRQVHPTWTVEQLKALAMNGAIHNVAIFPEGNGTRYGPSRIGAGRVDPVTSAQLPIIAYNAEEAGVVSLTFNSEVLSSLTQTKKLRVVNYDTVDHTYDLGIDTVVDAPGLSFSLPGGSSVTVPAGATVDVNVQMDGTGTQMKHARDATVAATQTAAAPVNTTLNRFWLTEEGAYVTFSQSGNLKLRVPVYSSPRAASAMAAAGTVATGGAPTGSTTIPLSGTDVCTGTLGAGPACSGTFPNDEVSLVTPFELQVASPRDPTIAPGFADLQYAGVSYDSTNNVIYFGVSTWEKWSTPTDVAFNIYIDTDSNGTWDRILFNSNPGSMDSGLFGASASATDAFITGVLTISTSGVSLPSGTFTRYVNRISPTSFDTAPFNSNVMFFGAAPSTLGLAGTSFRYKIVTCPGFAPLCAQVNGFQYDSATGPYSWNYNAQGLNFGNTFLAQDLNGASLPVTWDTTNMTTNGSLGALLLHHHNSAGNQSQVVLLDNAQSSDMALSYSAVPANPTLGQNVTLTLTATNNGPNAATGIVVTDILPGGLTYVSDDGAGAYNTGTGQWTVGSLAVSGSATLHIVATVNTTDQVQSTAQISSGTPLDTNPANNQASITLMAPRSADLVMGVNVSSPTVVMGNTVTYNLTVTNNGDDPAYSLNVNENFPSYPSLNPSSFTASQGVYNPSTGVWNLASLGKGTSATLALNVTAPNTPGPLTEQANATSSTTDPNSSNNLASATTMVVPLVSGTKTVSGGTAPGSIVTYTITLTNNGSTTQEDNAGNEFSDVLPAGLSLLDDDATNGAVSDNGTNTVNWNGSIPGSGGSVTITIRATINNDVALGTTISNQGTINYDGDHNGTNESSALTDDPSVGGGSDPTSFTVLSPANISGRKSVSGTLTPGSTITYLIELSSSLSSSTQFDNPGNEFVDVLPSDLTLVSADASAGTAVANTGTNTVTWNGVIAGGGDSVTITVIATIKAGTEGHVVSNQGTINYDADGNGTNEASTLTDDPNTSGSDATVFTVCAATHVVTTNADNGAGSLRQAVADACPGTSITFSGVTSPVALTGGEILIDKNLTITGPNVPLTISGSNNSRIFNIQHDTTVTISNLTFTNGKADAGGAIFNAGSLTIANSTFTGNNAVGLGAEGGAIDSEGYPLAGGRLNIINSTISGNASDGDGGGVLNCGNSAATLTNVTITKNRSDANGDDQGNGGGLAQVSSSDLTLNNTIIAGNLRGAEPSSNNDVFVRPDDPMTPDPDGSFIDASSSNNLIGVDTGLSTDITNGINGNQIGTAASPIDPKLRALADNGGPTQTHLLLLTSPALNAGNSSLAIDQNGSPLTTDHRGSGFPRVVGSAVDIGAVEANYSITATAGTPQSTNINSAFATAMKATVTESGNPQNGVSVTFTAPGSGASGTFPGPSATAVASTNSSGVATAPTFTANGIGGSYNVIASIGTGLPTASFVLTNNKASTATAVSSSPNPSNVNQSVTFTATVTSASGTPTGTVQFKDGGTSIGSPQTLNGSGVATFSTSSLAAGVHTITADYSGDAGFLISSGTLSGGQQVGSIIRFSTDPYSTTENSGFTTITVQRIGDLSQAVTVDYATPDDSSAMTVLPCSNANGVASPRCDFEAALGTIRFAAGDGASKTFTVLINQDNFVEGPETLTLTLSNLTGGAGFTTPGAATSTATLAIADDVTEPATNPLDDTDTFVRQLYRDFLNRAPDASGLAFWKDNIDKCNDPARRPAGMGLVQCFEVQRINTAASFFLSIEFQNTGFFVERIYKAGFGDISPPTVPVPVRFINFLGDTQQVGSGVIVLQGSWQTQLENNKTAFALAFVQRAAFLTRYPALTSATALVDSWNANAGNVLTDSERSALISELSPNPADPNLRASVLKKIAENATLQQREFNRAFVLLQYFGFLRRNPDAAPEPNLNFAGYNFWLNKLNQFNGNFIDAEMVKAFLSSFEYRKRFGP